MAVLSVHRYGAMLNMVESGKLRPEQLVGRRISPGQAPEALMTMHNCSSIGATVITDFT